MTYEGSTVTSDVHKQQTRSGMNQVQQYWCMEGELNSTNLMWYASVQILVGDDKYTMCLCMCLRVSVCVYVYLPLFLSMLVYVSLCLSVSLYPYRFLYPFICLSVFLSLSVLICLYTHPHTPTYIYIYIYAYISFALNNCTHKKRWCDFKTTLIYSIHISLLSDIYCVYKWT